MLNNMNIEQLKAHAYDCLAQIEGLKAELTKTNQAIAESVTSKKVTEPVTTNETNEKVEEVEELIDNTEVE